jgi:hypothetical protein
MALLLTALSLVASAFAQSTSTSATYWSAITFTYHGEKVPSLSSTDYSLTPLGAYQLYAAGQLIRARYVDPSLNASDIFTFSAPINGLSTNMIANSQLYVLGTDDEYVSGSAMAFMQGLYPPVGFVVNEESEMANMSVVSGPLGNYQYPSIESVGALDFNYIW